MASTRNRSAKLISKTPTGIVGFDGVTSGGLPRGRTTLLGGSPGSGKTIFAMNFLVHGAKNCNEPGIFVAFEEAPGHIATNFKSFGWPLAELQAKKKLTFLDGQPSPELIQAGGFDLGGMFAILEQQIRSTKAKRIVFDALDIVLDLLPDIAAKRQEVYRLHQWLLQHELTALITAKAGGEDWVTTGQPLLGFMQFMVDSSVILNHRVTLGVSQRSLRIQKYRGSSFDENELPFVIGNNGFDIATPRANDSVDITTTTERVSSGVPKLDTMLGGGYLRGASILITGFPGTAKTSLSGAFAEAACLRGERTTYITFDSDGSEVIRNLTSIGVRLQRFVKSGLLRMVSARGVSGSAENLMMRIKTNAMEHKSRCLVVDPVSTLSRSGNELTAHNVVERLVDWSKTSGMTTVCTSLQDEMGANISGNTPLQVSTLADTWIHLNYLVQAGERNRGLSIIKSRGTSHSNQVRELVLSDKGISLADIYTAGGEVLMGTLRWEKESAERVAKEVADVADRLRRVRLDAEEALLRVRAKSLKTELLAKQEEKTVLAYTEASRNREQVRNHKRLRELRSADGSASRRLKTP